MTLKEKGMKTKTVTTQAILLTPKPTEVVAGARLVAPALGVLLVEVRAAVELGQVGVQAVRRSPLLKLPQEQAILDLVLLGVAQSRERLALE